MRNEEKIVVSKAKEFCQNNPIIGYSTELGGIEVHGFEYGTYDYIYCTTNNFKSPHSNDKKVYHRIRVETRWTDDVAYFRLYGKRILLNSIIRLTGWSDWFC